MKEAQQYQQPELFETKKYIKVDTALDLTAIEAYILLSLLEGPKHGYSVIKDVFDFTNQVVNITSSSIYRTLHKFQNIGYVNKSAIQNFEDERRIDYLLSRSGIEAVSNEAERMQNFIEIYNARKSNSE